MATVATMPFSLCRHVILDRHYPPNCAMLSHISPLIRYHFKFFRACGYAPISLAATKAALLEERLWMLWSLLLLGSYNGLAIYAFSHRSLFLYTKDDFGLFVDSIKLLVTSITMNIVLCEPIVQRARLKRFWTLYAGLNRYRGLDQASLSQQLHEYRFFFGWFYGYTLANLLIECYFVFFLHHNTEQLFYFWLMFLPYVYGLRFRDLHMQFQVELVRKELQHLAHELTLLVLYTEFGVERQAFGRFDGFIRDALREKQLIYMQIHEMVECFKLSSGFSLMAQYLKAYIRIVVDLFWAFWDLGQNFNDIKDLLILPALFEIPIFLITSKNCMNAVKYIALQLHSIKHNVENVPLSQQIQNFSLQLLHQKIRIDAMGITVMDGYMLSKTVGSITTYMIFFIQFMPKFQKL